MAFSQLLARKLSTSAANLAIRNVTVIGGGLMGSGIAQVAAQSGFQVTMVDLNEDLLNATKGRVSKSLARVAKKKYGENSEEGKKYMDETLGRINSSTNPVETAKTTDLVIEAIVENLDIKKKLFKELDEVAPESAIFASNTSSLPIRDISSLCSEQRLANFGGLHFFNPVPVMKLVEIVRIPQTSDETYQNLKGFTDKLGKVSVETKDTPGFIVNRLLVPYMASAVKMLERGDATAKDIDVAMKLGAGYPMGPFELSDYVGLDTIKFIMDGWHKEYPDIKEFEPSELVNKLVSEGKLGAKSGEGFYKYNKL